jgi:hypothetical protein
MVPPHDQRSAATAAGRNGSPPSPIDEGGFPLTGASEHPDPTIHAYRQDLADVALAGRVVASHYAEPLSRHLTQDTSFLTAPDDEADPIATLKAGDELRILDNSRGWAWGYAPDGRVGYVRSGALAI